MIKQRQTPTRTVDDVTDGEDVWYGRLESRVDGDAASRIRRQTDGLESQFVRVRTSTYAHQQHVAVERLFLIRVFHLKQKKR